MVLSRLTFGRTLANVVDSSAAQARRVAKHRIVSCRLPGMERDCDAMGVMIRSLGGENHFVFAIYILIPMGKVVGLEVWGTCQQVDWSSMKILGRLAV